MEEKRLTFLLYFIFIVFIKTIHGQHMKHNILQSPQTEDDAGKASQDTQGLRPREKQSSRIKKQNKTIPAISTQEA